MVLDIVVALIIAYGFYSGFSKGVIGTVFSILSLLLGLLVAMKLSPIVMEILQSLLNVNIIVINIIGFVLTFVVVIFLVRLIGKKLEDLLKFANLNFVNKLLGGALLALVFGLITSHGVWFLNKTKILSEDQLNSSITYPLLEPLPRASEGIVQAVKPLVVDFWEKMVESIDSIKEESGQLNKREVEEG